MKKYFLKKTHIYVSVYVSLLYVMIVAILMLVLLNRDVNVVCMFVCFAVVTITTFFGIKFINSIGLYVNETYLYYKVFRKRVIDTNTIAGIKIVQAYGTSKYKSFYPLKNAKGELLYSAIFLKTINDSMYDSNKGDLWFNRDYKDSIICSVTYESEVIEYLKSIIPGLIIL